MTTSILDSVKEQVNVPKDYDAFDGVLITYINAVIPTLRQLGVDIPEDFIVENRKDEWEDMLPFDADLEAVKTYIGFKVRLMFDPPANGIIMECMNSAIREAEWRINVHVDKGVE